MDLGLRGKVALVTGGTSGIGFAIAKILIEEECRVIVASRSEENVARAVDSLRRVRADAMVEGHRLDMVDEASLRAALADISSSSPIDILVNNVGGPAAGNVLDISLEDWDRGYRALLRSVILLNQLVVPHMREKGWGRILTVTSTSARELIPKLPVSSTFRAGLTALAKELAKALGRSGILVNNLLPGPTATDRLKELEQKSPAFYKSMAEESALGRVGEPEEVARVAVFLLSAANTFVTGTDILADGGYTKAL